MNLAKYRKAQSDLDEAEERLEESAAELNMRSRLKNTMSATATRAGAAGVSRPIPQHCLSLNSTEAVSA